MNNRPSRQAAVQATQILLGIAHGDCDECSTSGDESLDVSTSSLSSASISPVDEIIRGSQESYENSDSGEDASVITNDSQVSGIIYTSKDGKEKWSANPVAPLSGRQRQQNVLKEGAGPTRQTLERCVDPKSAFSTFITNEMLAKVCAYTNKEGSHLQDYQNVNFQELKQYVGLVLLAGVYRGSKEPISHMWNKRSGRPIFSETMARNRFSMITKCLRFDDKDKREHGPSRDKLQPIREFSQALMSKCRANYKPSENLCIDEQLVIFRGRCGFKVYIPSKPGKYGIKIWVCADVATSYCCNFDVYTGQTGRSPEIGQAERVVLQLAEPYFGSGRNITADNFFSSLHLTRTLLTHQLTYVGTVRKNKPFLPLQFQTDGNRPQLSSTFGFQENISIVTYVPKPKKSVVLISSLHYDAECSDRPDKKPAIILTYNSTKSGVDNLDHLVRTYSSIRKTKRWPLTLFFNFLDIAAYNAMVCYIYKYPEYNCNKSHKRRIFIEELAMQLIGPKQPLDPLQTELTGKFSIG